MKIEWDSRKARLNLKKHGVAFEESATALSDPMAVTGADPDPSDKKSDMSRSAYQQGIDSL